MDFQSSITEPERALLTDLARDKKVLEIGSAYGYTTCFMAQVATEVLAVDPHAGYGAMPGSLPAMRQHIAALGIENIEMMIGLSQQVLPIFISDGMTFDLVFVDGDHRYASAQFDLAHSWPLVAEGGAMAVHDYGEITCPEVVPAVDDWFRDLSNGQAASWSEVNVTDTLWTIRR